MPLIYNQTTIPETSTALTYNGKQVLTVMYGTTKVWEVGPAGFGWPNGQTFHCTSGGQGGSWPALPFDAVVSVSTRGGLWSGVDADSDDSWYGVYINGSLMARSHFQPETSYGDRGGSATVTIKAGTGLSITSSLDTKRYEMWFTVTTRKAFRLFEVFAHFVRKFCSSIAHEEVIFSCL